LVAIGVYCVNCTKFGQLILRKISEIVATRCQILRLKCTKFDFGWGGGAYNAPQTPKLGLRGPTSKERGREGRGGEGRGREWEGNGGEGGEGLALSIRTFYFMAPPMVEIWQTGRHLQVQ